jgi:hypothetical protein
MNPSEDPKGENPWGKSLPVELMRNGWTPHCFPNTKILVLRPPGVMGVFNDKGVLNGGTRVLGPFFSATLHSNRHFTSNRKSALDFVDHLARKKGAKAVDVATYRYFVDPTESRNDSRIITFYVIGIPGAVVVVTLSRPPDAPPSELVERIRQAIPQIVGEVA